MKKVLFIYNPDRAHEMLALFDTDTVVSVRNTWDILRLLFRKEKYSAVIIDAFGRHGIRALLSVLLLRAPLVLRLRGDFFREEAERIKAGRGVFKIERYLNLCLGRLCFRVSRLVIANSRHIADTVRRQLKKKPIAIVHNPYMPTTGAPTALKLPDGGLRLLTVTNMNFYSKIDPTIEAIEGWVDKRFLEEMDIYWVICGSGIYLERLREAVIKRGLDGRVLAPGWVNGMEGLYDWSDVLVHLTRLDAFPNATMEAMMKGKPVVTNSKSCGTREQVFDGLNGVVVSGKAEFLEAIRTYAEAPGLKAKHGEAGRRLVQEKFTAEIQKKEMRKALGAIEASRASINTGLIKKTELALRMLMVRFLSVPLRLYTVNEYPKSGGTWVGQMLGRALGLPFPRNRFPSLRSSIMHGHYLNSFGLKKVTIVWRDGRDVMVSWYHHCIFANEHDNSTLVTRVRKDLPFKDYSDVYNNLPAFIEYSFTIQKSPMFSWSEFVRRWHGRPGCVHVRYEDLKENTVEELKRIVKSLAGVDLADLRAREIADEFSIARQSGRNSGTENKASFMRKGVVGDWRNHFSPEAKEAFDRFAGEELILLGYEKDRSWVAGKKGF